MQLTGLGLPPGFDVPPGPYTVVLRGDAHMPFNRDPASTAKPNVPVADPSSPFTVLVTAPAKK